MRTVLLSDAHLRADDAHQAGLCAFLDQLEADELVLGGDIFDAWWGWEHAVFSAFVPFLASLDRLVHGGMCIWWIPGNHDAHAGGYLERNLGLRIARQWRRSHGLRVGAMHGDQFEQGVGQRLLNRLLQGRAARLGTRLLGPDRSWEWGLRLAGRNRARGHDEAAHQALLSRQHRWADRVLERSGLDLLCVGHTHAPGVIDLPHGRLVNLGDWLHHRTWVEVEAGELDFYRWDEGQARALQLDAPRRRPWANARS